MEEAYKVSAHFLISYQESIIKFYYFIFRFIYIRIDLNLLTLHFINIMLITFVNSYKSEKIYVYKLFITEYRNLITEKANNFEKSYYRY